MSSEPIASCVPLPTGGYDCDFVEQTPESLQCPICLLALRDPHLISCCGAKICAVCIERVKTANQPCPLCKQPFTSLLDKWFQRQVLDLKVWCSKRKDGCQWMGELRHLDQHELEECDWTVVQCECSVHVPRHQLSDHKKEECTQRPVDMKLESFMRKIKKYHEEEMVAINKHHKEEMAVVRAEIKKHHEEEVAAVKWQHKEEMAAVNKCHKEEMAAVDRCHKEEMAAVDRCHKEEMAAVDNCYKEEIAAIRVENKKHNENDMAAVRAEIKKQLKNKMAAAKAKMVKLHEKEMAALNEHLQVEMSSLRNEFEKLRSHLHVTVPCEVFMSNYSQNKRHNVEWFSSPFYSGPCGYKMCLNVDVMSSDANTHLSVFVYLMKGEHDEHLKWPFQGALIFTLVNQLNDDHYRIMTTFDGYSSSFGNRVTSGERSTHGWGLSRFISHTVLESTAGFIVKNSLKFRVQIELK